jgi:phosphohistidine phosphatase
MKIYLVRHGIAELRAIDRPDAERMLLKKGIVKAQKVARKLADLDIKFDTIITSPYRRAKETAIILQQANLSEKIVEHSALTPEGNILEWLNWLQEANYSLDSSICLVGHQPNLTDWAELLIWGKSQNKLNLKKAGIIGIELSNLNSPLGTSELFLLTSPKWMTN